MTHRIIWLAKCSSLLTSCLLGKRMENRNAESDHQAEGEDYVERASGMSRWSAV